MATITRLPLASSASERTVTPLSPWSIRRTGAPVTIRLPSASATRCGIRAAPPSKRRSCAPSFVLKLRSNVPWFSSLPDAAM
jgi:hypothetical protein